MLGQFKRIIELQILKNPAFVKNDIFQLSDPNLAKKNNIKA